LVHEFTKEASKETGQQYNHCYPKIKQPAGDIIVKMSFHTMKFWFFDKS